MKRSMISATNQALIGGTRRKPYDGGERRTLSHCNMELLDRLKIVSAADPQRVEQALNAIWRSDPSLLDLVLDATEPGIVFDEALGAARIASRRITVWEIVRAYRQMGSSEAVLAAFPKLTKAEIGLSILYSQLHPDEIDSRIDDFEGVLSRRRSEYPFSR